MFQNEGFSLNHNNKWSAICNNLFCYHFMSVIIYVLKLVPAKFRLRKR